MLQIPRIELLTQLFCAAVILQSQFTIIFSSPCYLKSENALVIKMFVKIVFKSVRKTWKTWHLRLDVDSLLLCDFICKWIAEDERKEMRNLHLILRKKHENWELFSELLKCEQDSRVERDKIWTKTLNPILKLYCTISEWALRWKIYLDADEVLVC